MQPKWPKKCLRTDPKGCVTSVLFATWVSRMTQGSRVSKKYLRTDPKGWSVTSVLFATWVSRITQGSRVWVFRLYETWVHESQQIAARVLRGRSLWYNMVQHSYMIMDHCAINALHGPWTKPNEEVWKSYKIEMLRIVWNGMWGCLLLCPGYQRALYKVFADVTLDTFCSWEKPCCISFAQFRCTSSKCQLQN